MRNGPNNDRRPYVMYPFITREIWDKFVEKCSSKEFQAKSEKARISQAANKHPHFLGQKSYAEMIPIWQSRGYIPSATASSVDSSTSSLIPPCQIGHCLGFSTARKGRGMDDEEIQALEARLSQRVREQTLETNSKIDALV
ncbi:uncharacterized protein LOC130589706 [Beta vulgaris subsp. vulgaris]|uniref:uncharacterized protein LOC130589706 n=1 Tax=Beta vulgaris subsp. vulgaris TaxID=3555 RepID=UPI0025465B9D|nr:uncharacterized protein LOC130589706 [Beta vulgaris subsp. vulgaris]